MSRSHRNPFIANAPIESEKADKQRAHQRERKWFHDHLHPNVVQEEDFDIVSFHEHPKSGREIFAKHGKAFAEDNTQAQRK
jgi:hypothetical protein